MNRLYRRLVAHIPPAQMGRYLLVGFWNTAFGYGCYLAFTLFFTRLTHFYPYVFANLAASLLNISVAFLGYKWFVFKTHGNYLKEWLRCLGVYSGIIVLSTAALPPLVGFLRHATEYQKSAPYIAGAIVMAATVVLSFFGHKYFSFRTVRDVVEEDLLNTSETQRTP